ncbi:MAG: tripartite tricarboxylate transporter substrate binding protein [Xanthobacteraceae bacterium]|nr:tripartite tricarboxylate transporter substrate binding protein [Xanthobacteraceae bacterium]
MSAAIRRLLVGTALLTGLAVSASAQEQPAAWPSRPVKIITPLAAGGAADILARAVGDELFATLKQPVVIENRPGGGGILAAGTVARAQPDGYTLLLGTAGTLTITPVLAKNVTFDPVADFTPLTIAIETPICLVVHKDLPVSSVAGLVAYAKANPGKLSFGSSGPNTTHHLAGEFLKSQAGIDMVHVPYRGGNPAMTDFLAGQIPVLFATLSTVLPHLSSGSFKVLGTIEASRSRARPEIPTIGESVPGYAVPSSFLGFLAPAGLPEPMTGRLNVALVKTIETPSVRRTLEGSGFEVTTGTSAQFGAIIKAALERYRKIAADARIEPQ